MIKIESAETMQMFHLIYPNATAQKFTTQKWTVEFHRKDEIEMGISLMDINNSFFFIRSMVLEEK